MTLLELLLVLTLLSLFSFSVISAYREWISKNQLRALVNTVQDSLEYARDSAITLHTTTVFCGSDNGVQCDQAWQQGQLIVDAQNQRVLRVLPSMPKCYRFEWHGSLGDSTDLRFQSDGFTRGQQGSFLICNAKKTALSAKLVLLRSGRVRVETGNLTECN